jgi:predicted GIY-YIG superfamily endonuclease
LENPVTESVAPHEAASVPALVTAEAPPGALNRPAGAQMLLHNAAVAANWRAFHVGVPEGFTAYVYRYRDLAGNLLYVGMTSNATRRAGMHLEDSDWTSWVASVEYRRCRSRDEAFKLESKIRNNERPLFVNQAGYAALMAELDARYQINHVAGTCDCVVDPRRSAGFMRAAVTTLPDEQEAQAISDRVREVRERRSNRPRRSRGRIGYGAIAVPTADGAPMLVPDTDGTAPIAAEASRRVIAGETVMSVTADLNKRGVPAKEGGLWHAAGLWKICKTRYLLSLASLVMTNSASYRQHSTREHRRIPVSIRLVATILT